jgi:hypothetical protein
VLAHLPAAGTETSVEVAHRLDRIRQTLLADQAQQSLQPTHVTLQARQIPLSQALAAIEEQTGNSLIDYRGQFGQQAPDPELNLDFEQTPFWRAMDELLDTAGMTTYHFAGKQGLALINTLPNQLPRLGRAAYSGIFRIEPARITAQRDLRSREGDSLDLVLEIAWEPRVHPIAIAQPLETLSAVDARGEPLAFADGGAVMEVPVQRGSTAVEISIPMKLPPRDIQQIMKLTGTFQSLVPGKVEEFRFTGLADASGSEQRKGKTTILVENVRKNNDIWEVRMRARYEDAAGALESHRGWVFNNEAYLETTAGEKIQPQGFQTTAQTETDVGVAFLFELPDGPEGLSFVYKTPTVFARLPIEYELSDIPLP